MLKPPYNQNKRIWEIDFARGICILLMVFDHLMLTIDASFSQAWTESSIANMPIFLEWVENYLWNKSNIRLNGGREFVVMIFILLCGISTGFSKSNLKRGIQLMICGLILSVGSYIIDKDNLFIHFGVLHMLASCILIWWVLMKLFKNPIGRAGIAVSLGVILLLVESLFVEMKLDKDPVSFWSVISESTIVKFVKIENKTRAGWELFSPGDYFPLLPNISIFFFGAAASFLLYPKKKTLLPTFDGIWSKPIEFVGRHTLIIMMLHLVIITIILSLLSYFFITPGSFGFSI